MFRASVCAALLFLSCEAALAKDLGVRGETFPVSEPDLFDQIAAKFAALQEAGEVDRINQRLRDRAIAAAERPPRVDGIIRTESPRAFHYDPTIVLKEDIATPDGTVIARAGETFNPLDYTPMQHRMIFFDGDDPEQVAWAEARLSNADVLVSPILIGGPVLDITRQWKRQVFFDQGGKLTGQFGITQVPAAIRRDGDMLLVEEVEP